MIKLWFFLAFFLGPGMAINSTQNVIHEYVETHRLQATCELSRGMFYEEFNGEAFEDGIIIVSDECYEITITEDGEEV